MKRKDSFVPWLVLTLLSANFMACALLPQQEAPANLAAIKRIAPEDLKNLMDEDADIVIVDTMPADGYKKAHIKGAVNLPWHESIEDPVDLPNKFLVVYCDCPNEETSMDMAEQLTWKWNYKNVMVLKGGWNQWVNLGYPIE